MLQEGLYGENEHISVLQLMVDHCRQAISEPNYPKDAALSFGSRLQAAEKQLNSRIDLPNVENTLRELADDINQYANVAESTNTQGRKGLFARTFNSIFNR